MTQRCDTKVPNVFTPNGDGLNETFEIFGIEGFRGSALQVFDRWGALIFEDKDYKNNWSYFFMIMSILTLLFSLLFCCL